MFAARMKDTVFQKLPKAALLFHSEENSMVVNTLSECEKDYGLVPMSCIGSPSGLLLTV